MHTGYHAVYESGYPEAIDTAKRFGFDFVQFDLGVPTFFLDGLQPRNLDAIKAYAGKQGVGLTFHAPGDNGSLFCDYPEIRAGNRAQFLSIIGKANRLGARHITFHTGQPPAFKQAGSETDVYSARFARHYADVLRQNLGALLRAAGPVLVCVENTGFTPLIMEVLASLIGGGSPLYLTLDTAKAYTGDGRPDRAVLRFMADHRERVREVHIHDWHPAYGGHQTVGDGVVDFRLFEDFLFQDSVYMNFEVRPAQAAYQSKQRLLELFHRCTSSND